MSQAARTVSPGVKSGFGSLESVAPSLKSGAHSTTADYESPSSVTTVFPKPPVSPGPVDPQASAAPPPHKQQATEHIPDRDPTHRQNQETKWPNGVLSAGRIIDILERLSPIFTAYDYAIVLRLQTHYIQPFGRLERRDELVVTSSDDRDPLLLAYERFINLEGDVALAQRLWVPGLEPMQQTSHTGSFAFPTVPKNTVYKAWRAGEAFVENGYAVQKKGTCEGNWTDGKGWQREIWSAKTTGSINPLQRNLFNATLRTFRPTSTLSTSGPTDTSQTAAPTTTSTITTPSNTSRAFIRADTSRASTTADTLRLPTPTSTSPIKTRSMALGDVANPSAGEKARQTKATTTDPMNASGSTHSTREHLDDIKARRRQEYKRKSEELYCRSRSSSVATKSSNVGNTTGPSSRRGTRQIGALTAGASRMPCSSATVVETLDSITDETIRDKVKHLKSIFPVFTLQQIFDTLTLIRGYFDSACNFLAEESEKVERVCPE